MNLTFNEIYTFANGYIKTYFKDDKRLHSGDAAKEIGEMVNQVLLIKKDQHERFQKHLDSFKADYKAWKGINTFANSPIKIFTYDSVEERIDNLKKSKLNAAFDIVLCLLNVSMLDGVMIKKDDYFEMDQLKVYLFTALSLFESATIHLKEYEEVI